MQALADALDTDAVRSRTTSLLRTVSRQMTGWARELELEHSEYGAQIDVDRLTIVADTPQRARLHGQRRDRKRHELGRIPPDRLPRPSAFFLEQQRPVPAFLVLDQPSQAFFPRDQETGGDLDELTDTDREDTRRLYELTHQVVERLGGALQVIALDHADFDDDWFSGAVVQRWRDGKALIPAAWREDSEGAPDPRCT